MSNNYKLQYMEGIKDKGIYNKSNWLKEANRHLYSSCILHEHFLVLKKELSLLVKDKRENELGRNALSIHRVIDKIEGSSKSSLLLLCYSVELFIKAALVCFHSDITKGDFEFLLRKVYSHKFELALGRMNFKLSDGERIIVKRMEKFVVDEGRYPITPIDNKEYYNQASRLSHEMWLSDKYNSWLSLAKKIGDFSALVDNDFNNRSKRMLYKMDDGYFCFRVGGGLPPCITVRFSSEQVELGLNTKKDLYCLIRDTIQDEFFEHLFNKYESEIVFIEIKNTK